MDLSKKHLNSSSPAPSVDASRYTLFGNKFCPFVDQVRYTLAYHKINYDLVLINLGDKPTWFSKYAPEGKVPVFAIGGERLTNTDLILPFVDQIEGLDSSLLIVCGEERFKDVKRLTREGLNVWYGGIQSQTIAPEVFDKFDAVCANIQKELKGNYLEGEDLSLADLVLFPLVDRMDMLLACKSGVKDEDIIDISPVSVSSHPFPKLAEYLVRMRGLPFIKSSRVPTSIKVKFLAGLRVGKADPDVA